MRGLLRMVAAFCILLPFGTAVAAEKPSFGPMKYDVKERWGTDNRYTATFTAPEGPGLIKLQNGEKAAERPDRMTLSVNGEGLLREGAYTHPVMGCFVPLKRENSVELSLKDAKPTGLRRPKPTPKFTTITVLAPPVPGVQGVFGALTWDLLLAYVKSIKGIKNAQAASLAQTAAGLQNDIAARAEAVRKLSDLKEPSAQDFLHRLYADQMDNPGVRAEAALAIGVFGDVKSIPGLLNEVLNPSGAIRTASARALSFYPEQDTAEPLKKLLSSLDTMRKTAVLQALVEGEWKPVPVLMDLAKSPDAHTANLAIEMLGGLQDPRSADLLLSLLANPGKADRAVVITALGKSKVTKAVEPLLAIANDPAQRTGLEVELAEALAELGDQRAAPVIGGLIKKADTRGAREALREAYKKLTGKEYK